MAKQSRITSVILAATVALALLLTLGNTAVAQKEKGKSSDAKAAQPTAPAQNAAAGAALSSDEYVLGPQDGISISVWREPDFSGAAVVRPDGKITVPLLGDVQAAGMTPGQLGSDLALKLTKYVSQPKVTITVTAMNSQRYYMAGQVARPGAFPLLPNTTVLQAISSAGGPGPDGNPKKAYILRTENGKQVKLPVDYAELIKGNKQEQNIILKAGDTVVIP